MPSGIIAVETAHITNLYHELRAEDRANAKHPHHDRVLWKLRSQSEHLMLNRRNCFYDYVELNYRMGNKALDRVGHWKHIHL